MKKSAHNGETQVLYFIKAMGNTVGSMSTNFCNFNTNSKDAYILGLWCADGYYWSSSIGLSNTDIMLIKAFRQFLRNHFSENRIKIRIYPIGGKRKTRAYHLYVNSRPLLREFIEAEKNLANLGRKVIPAYIAGRFDGDGSIDKNLRNDCRITYSNLKEAEQDKILLGKIGFKLTKVYYYKNAKTFCVYISRYEVKNFIEIILPFSIKLQKLVLIPCRDLVVKTTR